MPVTLADLRTECLDALQLVSGDIGNTQLDRNINRAKQDVQRDVDLHYQDRNRTFSTVAGAGGRAGDYALPSDWKSDILLYIIDGTERVILRKMNREAEIQWYPPVTGATQARPQFYDTFGTNIVLSPVPDAVYTVNHDYLRFLADLSAGTDSDDITNNYPRLVVAGACKKLSEDRGWWDDAIRWREVFGEELKRILRVTLAGKISGQAIGSRPPHQLRERSVGTRYTSSAW